MRRSRRSGGLDLGVYLRGVGILAKHPVLVVPIFVAQLVVAFLFRVTPGEPGAIGTMTYATSGLLAQIIDGFGFCTAVVGASLAWRGVRNTPAEMFSEARLRLGSITWGVMGFNFVPWAAASVATFLLPGSSVASLLGLGLSMIALFFVIYTMPAASVGGTPGAMAINVSVEQARANPLPTGVITAVYIAASYVGPAIVAPYLFVSLLTYAPQLVGSEYVMLLIETLVFAIFGAWVAVVLTKIYEDLSLGGFRF